MISSLVSVFISEVTQSIEYKDTGVGFILTK